MHLSRLPHRRLPGGVVLAEASTPLSRLVGLAWGAPPPAGWALRLAPCRSVHTVGMRFALDLVWLDGADRVVRVDLGVAPWRARSCRAARSVIEVAAGGAARVVQGVSRAGCPPTPGPAASPLARGVSGDLPDAVFGAGAAGARPGGRRS